jgi:hypothetical protein
VKFLENLAQDHLPPLSHATDAFVAVLLAMSLEYLTVRNCQVP